MTDLTRRHQASLETSSRDVHRLQDRNERLERALAEARELAETMELERDRLQREKDDISSAFERHLHECEAERNTLQAASINEMELERNRLQSEKDDISSAFERHLLECEAERNTLRAASTNPFDEYEITIPAEEPRIVQTEMVITEPSVVTMARFLSLSSDANGAVKKECLPLLLRLFISEIPHIQLWAVEALAQLLASTAYRKPAFEIDCITALAKLLGSASSDVQYYALLALERLCTTERDATRAMCHSQAIHAVVDMLSSDGRVSAKAADVVYEVLGWQFGMSLLNQVGMLPALRAFVGSGSVSVGSCIGKIGEKLANFDRA